MKETLPGCRRLIPTPVLAACHWLHKRIEKSQAPPVEGLEEYHVIQKRILESARSARDDIKLIVKHDPGSPVYDVLPEIIQETPVGVPLKIVLLLPDQWREEESIRGDVRSLFEMAEERGNAELRYQVIKEDGSLN